MDDGVLQNSSLVKNLNDMAKEYEGYSVTKEYNRGLYQDDKAMEKCIDEAFDGRKTIISDLTGKTLHRDNKAADRKYGEKAATSHRAEPDHDDPLAKIHGRNKNKKYINDVDLKDVGNRKDNLKAKPMNVNRSKREASNIEALKKKKYSQEITTTGKVKEVIRGKKNELESDFLLNKRVVERGTVVNANKIVSTVAKSGDTVINTSVIVGESFQKGAKQSVAAAAIPLTVEAIRRLYNVAEGEEKLSEVVKDIGKNAGQIVIIGGAKNIMLNGVSFVFKKNGKENLLRILNSNEVAQIIAVAMIVKDSAFKYINCEIDGEQFLEEVQEQGIVMTSGLIGAIAGSILIPIPVVGQMVGSFIASTVCAGIFREYHNINVYKIKENEISKICSDALDEIKKQQDILKDIINKEFTEWDDKFKLGLKNIYDATIANDVEGIAKGLDKILNTFKENIKFETYKEFDEFFMDESNVLRL
ncbi:hypothetical protein [Clostridium sp. C2-6-12]|uniref:hypothetical protein n=1 Tax=Clostridium sp. C2-6-12 TaxID=2698832 RepID=UPI001368C58D|nr:hypothetical protein [Clostridium sp. C2-6-12]